MVRGRPATVKGLSSGMTRRRPAGRVRGGWARRSDPSPSWPRPAAGGMNEHLFDFW